MISIIEFGVFSGAATLYLFLFC